MIDHSYSDQILKLVFAKLIDNGCNLKYPYKESLSYYISSLLQNNSSYFSHSKVSLFASASMEMWQRAIHSFIWSVALTEHSRIWSSVTGYYASHYIMRAFAHAFGFFKSFTERKLIKLDVSRGNFPFTILKATDKGEHSFYWKVVKTHPQFKNNPLFRINSERDKKSDCSHRNYANYTDHLDHFTKLKLPSEEELETTFAKISRIHRGAVKELFEDKSPDLPDLLNVQILSYQRIITYRDFIDERINDNRHWRKHREPLWCKNMLNNHLLEDFDKLPISI
jgi:hypothetical protein